ncbi:phosphatidylinositol N-acetylglucosaminyltransferase-domain-containing protein [Xylariaceae sp. FL0804]|nr:phosphatidylinositol N-acetylglucosaminyltransferase-domain-containing protein [Xylariaceae sp. FL0804]
MSSSRPSELSLSARDAAAAATSASASARPDHLLTRANTLPPPETSSPSSYYSPRSSRSHLAPEDAFVVTAAAAAAAAAAPPSRRRPSTSDARPHDFAESTSTSTGRIPAPPSRPKPGGGSRSRSRRGRRARSWRKLLWVRQSYPDNYTDQATFLEKLQTNPRLQPYEFWPLVADTTVILQQVCSVTVFVVCFVGIFQERVSPVAVVGWGSCATCVGWLLWDAWVAGDADAEDEVLQRRRSNRSRAAAARDSQTPLPPPPLPPLPGAARRERPHSVSVVPPSSASSSVTNLAAVERAYPQLAMRQSQSASATSLQSGGSQGSSSNNNAARNSSDYSAEELLLLRQQHPHQRPLSPLRGGRSNLRLGTVKSAILIYFTLLGLSPILKSLTRSTSSDSIWAMSFWLLAVNIFFYDYSGGVAAKFPASLSTNAALMASTVLASRLPSTGQVFSLTLFSIEVFGLFPVFRRHARHQSWRYHVALSVLLVVGAGAGVGLILGGGGDGAVDDGAWPWKSGLLGVLVAVLIAVVAMGGCSWWLIGLQKYKNAINGPWDQARPIIISRRFWDDD